jgi:hypothetical protein
MFVEKGALSWACAICSYYGRIFADVSRIRTIADAYRDAYLHKGGQWDDLEDTLADSGMIWRMFG